MSFFWVRQTTLGYSACRLVDLNKSFFVREEDLLGTAGGDATQQRPGTVARSNRFCLVESLITCTRTRRKDLSRRWSVFCNTADWCPAEWQSRERCTATSRSFVLCERISSWTSSMFSTVRAVADRPLPGACWLLNCRTIPIDTTANPFNSV